MDEPHDGETAHRTARADVAAFMVEQLTSDARLREVVNGATS